MELPWIKNGRGRTERQAGIGEEACFLRGALQTWEQFYTMLRSRWMFLDRKYVAPGLCRSYIWVTFKRSSCKYFSIRRGTQVTRTEWVPSLIQNERWAPTSTSRESRGDLSRGTMVVTAHVTHFQSNIRIPRLVQVFKVEILPVFYM